MIFTCVALVLLVAQTDLVVGPLEPAGEGYTFTEGPLWVPSEGWIFTDIGPQNVQRADGSVLRSDSGGANGLALDREGRLLMCEGGAKRISRLEHDGSVTALAEGYKGKPFNAPNDLVVRSDGTIFFTDPESLRKDEKGELGFSGVYAISPDGTLTLLIDDALYPNGIGLSPDEKTLYVSDTRQAHIRAFDLSALSVSNGRVLCEVRIPDGLAVDGAGNVWCSSTAGISVFDAAGTPLGKIKVPMMPTNCAFGGEDGKTLFVTARKQVFTVRTATGIARAGE